MRKETRKEDNRAKYSPRQQAVVDLIRAQNRERSRERSRFSFDGGLITFRGHWTPPVGGYWLSALLYPLVLFMLYNGFVAGNRTLAVIAFAGLTLIYMYAFGVAHFIRSLAVTLLAVVLFVIFKPHP